MTTETATTQVPSLQVERADTAYLDFVVALRSFTLAALTPELHHQYQRRVAGLPAPPAALEDVRPLAESLPLYGAERFMTRRSQFMKWNRIYELADRDLERVDRALDAEGPSLGTLRLNPDLDLPAYFAGVEFHTQPGGYAGHPLAGVAYEVGYQIYTVRTSPRDEVNARIAAAAPPGNYRRILDLGCGHGNSTLGYLTVFPDAEVHGLDISGPMVRYAHRRAESQGKRAHFSQQNAERTDYPTGHFDLVSATILFHEVPPAAARNIVGEAHRLLAPGGAFVIADIPDDRYTSPLQQHLNHWQTRHNGEPYFTSFFQDDLIGIMQDAGFINVREYAASPDGAARFPWLTVGEKPA